MPWLLYPVRHPELIVQTESILHSICYTSVNNRTVFIILATCPPPRALSCIQTSTLYLSICFNHEYINIYMHTYVLYTRFKLPLINWSHYSLLNALNLYPTRDGGWGMNCNLSSWFMKNMVLFERKKNQINGFGVK
jgi:hypothetical protein